MRRAVVGVLVALGVLVSVLSAAPSPAAAQAPTRTFLPVFAYYYQWFDPPSWDRAKVDYPTLGHYSSDDVEVMRQHVRMAKAAGITGFLVSWKGSPTNDRRFHKLVDVARAENFGLAVNYESLDFDRNPLPAEKVAADLISFRDNFALDPVFHMLGRPLLVWSGTPKFSTEQISTAVTPIRDDVQVLGSEKDVEGYNRIADVVEGDAYYWSSVDPARDGGFAEKLRQLGDAVHSRGGLWTAPFSPGFDARLVGGSRTVDRRDGATLQKEYSAAVASSPDLLGLISWNEFSENTHVEPSANLGNRYLDVLSELAESPAPAAGELAQDSSAVGGASGGGSTLPAVIVGAGVVLVAAGMALARRRRGGHRHQRRAWRVPPGLGRPALALGLVVVLVGVTIVALRRGPAPPAPTPLPASGASPSDHYQGAKAVRDPAQVVLASAGDIACAPDAAGLGDEEANSATSCVMESTADVVGAIRPDAVLTLGDTQYPNGSLERFLAGYDTSWGAYKPVTYPVPGNHEYGTKDARGYFDYFGAAAGSPATGYYSYDLGGWHVIALNSECARIGGCGVGSAQERWLAADLAAHPSTCTLAYWHRPRYSSGHHGDNPDYVALWSALQAAGTELVLTGHDHDYERFAPMGPISDPDPAGIREFVVGTGGDSFYQLRSAPIGREAAIASQPGVLELTLRPDGYDWAFRTPDAPGRPKTADSGTAVCHAAGVA